MTEKLLVFIAAEQAMEVTVGTELEKMLAAAVVSALVILINKAISKIRKK